MHHHALHWHQGGFSQTEGGQHVFSHYLERRQWKRVLSLVRKDVWLNNSTCFLQKLSKFTSVCSSHNYCVLIFIPSGLPESVNFRFTGMQTFGSFLLSRAVFLLVPFTLPVTPWPFLFCRHIYGQSVGISGSACAWRILIHLCPEVFYRSQDAVQ